MSDNYQWCIIETLAKKIMEQEGEIMALRTQLTKEKNKNERLESLLQLKETEDN